MPKLILINGAIGSGKTTITQRYIDEHPLALSVVGDEIMAMLGQWLKYEVDARQCVFELTKSMATTHLKGGHDVLLPYLLMDPTHATAFKAIADDHKAEFFEILLTVDMATSVERALQRGTWGEPGTDPITEKDIPIIEAKYTAMEKALESRPGTVKIEATEADVDGTYQQLLHVLEIPHK
jgi:predicted kinase